MRYEASFNQVALSLISALNAVINVSQASHGTFREVRVLAGIGRHGRYILCISAYFPTPLETCAHCLASSRNATHLGT
jgi:hypothetical protein